MNLYFQSVSLGNSSAGDTHPTLRNLKETDVGRVPIRGDLAPGVVSKRAYTRYHRQEELGASRRGVGRGSWGPQGSRQEELGAGHRGVGRGSWGPAAGTLAIPGAGYAQA